MKSSERLLDAIEAIDENIVLEAYEKKKSAPKKSGRKLLALAACLVVILAVSAPFVSNWISEKDPLPPLRIVAYGKAYYEVVEDPSRFGLPAEVGEAMVGDFLADADTGGNVFVNDFDPSNLCKVYDCAELDCEAIKIIKDKNGEYFFIVFCNYLYDLYPELGGCTDADDMLKVFGVNSAEDIEAVACTERSGGELARVASREELARFFSLYGATEGIGNDEFQSEFFGGKSEAEQQELSRTLADEMKALRISVKNGLAVELEYYPSIGCFYQNMCYYKAPEALKNFMSASFGW